MAEKKFYFINSSWKNSFIWRETWLTVLCFLAIAYVSRLLMFVDAEDVIIFNIFFILIVLFFVLRSIITKTIYNNKLYLIALFYVNFYLQEKIILSLYGQLLKNKLLINLVNQVSSNWLFDFLEELNLLFSYNSLYLEYLNSGYLNNLLNELNREFIEKIEKIVDEVFILSQLNYYESYLSFSGVLEDGTSGKSDDCDDYISDTETFDFEELK